MASPTPLYPLKGIVFFFQHPKQLWLKTLLPFLLTLGFGLVSLFICLTYLLHWQAHALMEIHFPSWLAHTVAVVLSLIESGILDILCFAILLPFFQDALFDATLKARGLDRMLKDLDIPRLVVCCRGITSSLLVASLVVFIRVLILILTLPLNLIPIVGTVIACYINGFPATWSLTLHHDIELKGMTVTESRKHAWHNKFTFCNFGAVAVALELIPIVNLLFMWTNIVGAALWLGDIFVETEQSSSVDASTKSLYPSSSGSADNEQTRLLQQQQKDQDYGSAV
ncbi:hypothetical protein BJ944DRAFT_185999 [Cunninghamella echinulata]|nr:hypothetical protein BJ944DRAFT_185999 [Cunninghamella echinulata]